jgi:hypothetical protein
LRALAFSFSAIVLNQVIRVSFTVFSLSLALNLETSYIIDITEPITVDKEVKTAINLSQPLKSGLEIASQAPLMLLNAKLKVLTLYATPVILSAKSYNFLGG